MGKIELIGLQDEKIWIEISNTKLATLGVPMQAVQEALDQQNAVVPAGFFETGRRYGVVMKNGKVDARATAELRARMAKERGAVPLFDRGFRDIAELKSRCKAETGLDAPAAPLFQSRARAGKRAAVAPRARG